MVDSVPTFKIAEPAPFELTFRNNEGETSRDVGRLFLKDGKLHFEGDMDKSAEVFAEYLRGVFDSG